MYRKIGVYVDKTFLDKNDYSSDMVCVERSGRILREESEKLIQFIQERRMFYKCVGRLIGLSIINRQPLSTSFPLLFFKQLLEIPFEFDDLKDIDLQVYKSLIRLKQQDKDEFVTNEKSVNVIPFAPIPFKGLESMEGAKDVYKKVQESFPDAELIDIKFKENE